MRGCAHAEGDVTWRTLRCYKNFCTRASESGGAVCVCQKGLEGELGTSVTGPPFAGGGGAGAEATEKLAPGRGKERGKE